jgi:hypothetical protein
MRAADFRRGVFQIFTGARSEERKLMHVDTPPRVSLTSLVHCFYFPATLGRKVCYL